MECQCWTTVLLQKIIELDVGVKPDKIVVQCCKSRQSFKNSKTFCPNWKGKNHIFMNFWQCEFTKFLIWLISKSGNLNFRPFWAFKISTLTHFHQIWGVKLNVLCKFDFLICLIFDLANLKVRKFSFSTVFRRSQFWPVNICKYMRT